MLEITQVLRTELSILEKPWSRQGGSKGEEWTWSQMLEIKLIIVIYSACVQSWTKVLYSDEKQNSAEPIQPRNQVEEATLKQHLVCSKVFKVCL